MAAEQGAVTWLQPTPWSETRVRSTRQTGMVENRLCVALMQINGLYVDPEPKRFEVEENLNHWLR